MSSPQQEDGSEQGAVKEELDPLIKLKVVDQYGRRVFHTLRMSDKLQAVMDAYYYAAAADVNRGAGKFYFDGVFLPGGKTPAEFEMEDGDEIDFFDDQLGGGGPHGLDDSE
ncbi:hypothetical protein U9M48_015984 [Paspalum notatum var. saurae]|uniref:Ubiquitin-like domain-containing protein n=1 Tax=Paspalum notatum var. saurae TaxID=547442 RepID=A0AAQ3T6E3_PASNO